jgi:CBS domain-containing protein
MTVGRICIREVDLAEPNESARVAAQRMAARCVGTLLVVDAGRRPLGILTDRDLALRVMAKGGDPDTVRVRDVMTNSPRTVTESTPIEDALDAMRRHGVRRLPVVDGDGALIGILSFDDVLALLIEEFRSMSGILERSSPEVMAAG